MVHKIHGQRGSMLVNVLLLMFFLGALAYAASGMVRSSAQTATSSLRYQQVDWAAEYALNKGIDEAITNGCDINLAPVSFADNDANYVIRANQSPDDRFCFIRVEGRLQHGASDPQSTVVKTVTLPIEPGDSTGGKALATKGLGNNMNANGNHVVIESECVGLSYETCAWCENPNANQKDFLSKIEGNPSVAEEPFELGSFFNADDDDDVIDTMEQEVLAKAQELEGSGKGACMYVPRDNSGNINRQGKNCDTQKAKGNKIVLSCTKNGGNQIIDLAACAASGKEIAIYAESVNINQDFPADLKVFASVKNNLNITKSVNGVFSSDGVLNISTSGNEHLSGVFVGRQANNLNLSGTNAITGLLAYLDQSNLSVNLNGGGNTEQVICGSLIANGNVDFSRNGHAKLKYCQDEINKWLDDTSVIKKASCDATDTIMTNVVGRTRYKVF